MESVEVFRDYLADGEEGVVTSSSWRLAPARVQLRKGEVHLWFADQEGMVRSLPHLEENLSDDELERADRFHFGEHRNRFIARRGLLRRILGNYLSMPPAELKFDYGPFGKPFVRTGARISFNLSHSEGVVLYAVASGDGVGVDIEHIADNLDTAEIAKRCFSSTEVNSLFALPPSLQRRAFFDCWTRKEAYLKSRGQGLAIPLDSFSVSLAPGEAASLLRTEAGDGDVDSWLLLDVPVCRGYAAALAVRNKKWRLRCWQWTADWQG